jgi:GNAT superfamily N-acetyltransferase
MQIRRATTDDVPILVRLNAPVQALHVQMRPEMFKPPSESAEMHDFFRDKLTSPDWHGFIGEVDGQPVGYALAQVTRRPENPFTYAMEFIEIDHLSLNEDQRGKGYGEQLIQAVFDLARELNIDRVILGVWETNTHAIGFFKRQGFAPYLHRMEAKIT